MPQQFIAAYANIRQEIFRELLILRKKETISVLSASANDNHINAFTSSF
jgi:hypothetical protein